MPPAPLLTLKNIALGFDRHPLLDSVELAVGEGERLSLVGRNGSGKSTLLKIMAGEVEADKGERSVRQGATLRYLRQEPDLSGFATTRAYVEAGLAPGDDRHRVTQTLEALGLTGAENPANLSGGESRRAALARVLAPDPDILILDEPTNHLDLPAIEWLEATLARSRSAIVLVSHDRRLLERLSRATLWLDRGVVRRLDRGFSAFETWRDEVFAQEERDRQKLDRKIAAELDWLRYGVTARRARNQGRLRALHELRRKRREQLRVTGAVKFSLADAKTSGKLVIEAVGISKALGGRTLVRDFSIRVARGDRIGIVGPNGVGKTTLLNLLTGASPPDEGTVRLGANLATASLDQRRASLDPTTMLKDALTRTGGDVVTIGSETRHVMSYMKDFLFAPEQARQPLSALSGGERGRLMLARAFAAPSNLLVLDEPTNDLDIETLDLLQEMIADYSGTVILVSHDRDFVDRTVTSIIVAEGDGNWVEYAGGYSDMLAQRGNAPFAPASKPAKPEHKKPADKNASGAPRTTTKRKLSFKESHALEKLPDKIEALQKEASRLAGRLADPGFFASDPQGFERTAAALKTTEAALATAEDEWLRLSMLSEEIEG
jgi:ABC transport system ATP-binding/permease protein